MVQVDLNDLTEYFPWGNLYSDLGYAMPYPEVIMTSDRAYALQTQVSGLLMMQSWGAGNAASYQLEQANASHEAYTAELSILLPSLDEAWSVIGIQEDQLRLYMLQALASYIFARVLPKRAFRSVSLSPNRYMYVAE